jgi:Pentapeptide repeats (8 copies)
MTQDVDTFTMIDFVANVVKFWQIIIFVFGAYQFWASRRERLASDKVRNEQALTDSNYQAWQVVNSAQGKGGSGGRIDALANLVRNGQSLAGVNVDGAWLEGINLRGANLQHASFRNANLQGAILDGANLKHASFEGANLTAASLEGAYLQAVHVAGARLSAANLMKADLADLVGWRDIQSISYARINDIQRAPGGFRDWARTNGAEDAESQADAPDDDHGYSTQFRAV